MVQKLTKLVDSHAHLGMEEFDLDRDSIIQEAFDAGITAILCPGEVTDTRNFQTTLDMAAKYPNILATAGVHPHRAKEFTPESIRIIRKAAEDNQIQALGEIGLDFHYNFSPPELQVRVFRNQLNLAQELGLPVIIHSRMSAEKITQSISEERYTGGGILHCFTENSKFAHDMIERDFYISFSGIITFPKAHELRDVAKTLPLKRLLIETDSPYLTPAPYRGRVKRNKPSYLKETALNLAALRQMSFEEFAEVTTKNFENSLRFEITNF